MRAFLLCIPAVALAAPAFADTHDEGMSEEEHAVIAGADAFFDALRSDDKAALGRTMTAEGMIVVHDRTDPENPSGARIVHRSIADHLEGWLNSPRGLDEVMTYETVLVDGDMAQVWGPYRFTINGATTHCGINSMSLVRRDDGWKVGNTSFSMVSPDECDQIGAPGPGSENNF